MINRCQTFLFSSLLLVAGWTLSPARAHAELDACGGIFLSSDASCEYRPTEECMTQCMTVAVESSCVATIYNECETSCTATASTECESSCTDTCTNDCTTTTTTTAADQPPNCMGLCVSDCEQDCNDNGDRCDKYEHKGACGRCCNHNCAKRCEEQCKDVPPPKTMTTTECMPTCSTACSASCTAKANTTCQVDCQEKTYVMCEQQMVEKCQTDCKQTGGAIFCDGQFLDADNAKSCADELKSSLSIKIDISAATDAVKDTADDVGDATKDTANCVDDKVCAVSNPGAGKGGGLLLAFAPIGFLILRRLRRRNP